MAIYINHSLNIKNICSIIMLLKKSIKDKSESDFHLPEWPTTFPSTFQGFGHTDYFYNILK